jgi:hypothetical protein
MKKGNLFMLAAAFVVVLVSISMASAACNLNVQLLNQDPYPATPGEYVKVVFQVNGTENPECDEVFFDVIPTYPFSVDSNDSKIIVSSGGYIQNYPSHLLAGYRLRIDKNALDGDNRVDVRYGNTGKNPSDIIKSFYIHVDDQRTDFDVIIQDYNSDTNSITFGIINIGKKDTEALTIELPKQSNIDLRGSNKVIVGSLNANDDTTVSIKAIPKPGEILVVINYNDKIGVRRTVEKTIMFTDGYLEKGTKAAERGGYFYFFWALIILIIIYFVYGYFKKRSIIKNREKLLLRSRA